MTWLWPFNWYVRIRELERELVEQREINRDLRLEVQRAHHDVIEMARGADMNDWIKCAERMPDQGVGVLVYASGDHPYWAVASWAKNRYTGEPEFFSPDGEWLVCVDYWMPLPAPPSD